MWQQQRQPGFQIRTQRTTRQGQPPEGARQPWRLAFCPCAVPPRRVEMWGAVRACAAELAPQRFEENSEGRCPPDGAGPPRDGVWFVFLYVSAHGGAEVAVCFLTLTRTSSGKGLWPSKA